MEAVVEWLRWTDKANTVAYMNRSPVRKPNVRTLGMIFGCTPREAIQQAMRVRNDRERRMREYYGEVDS